MWNFKCESGLLVLAKMPGASQLSRITTTTKAVGFSFRCVIFSLRFVRLHRTRSISPPKSINFPCQAIALHDLDCYLLQCSCLRCVQRQGYKLFCLPWLDNELRCSYPKLTRFWSPVASMRCWCSVDVLERHFCGRFLALWSCTWLGLVPVCL